MSESTLGLEESIRSVEFIPQFFGLCPYNRDDMGLRPSSWKKTFSIAIVVVQTGNIMYWLLSPLHGLDTNFVLRMTFIKPVVMAGSTCICILLPLTSLHILNQAFTTLRWQSYFKTSMITESTYNGKRSYEISFLIYFVGHLLLDLVIFKARYPLQMKICFYLSAIITSACVSQFVGYINILKDGFRQIRDWIEQPRPCLEAAISSFEKLTTAAEYLKEAFGAQLLFIVGGKFIMATMNVFFFVVEKDSAERIHHLVWFLTYSSYPLRIVYAIEGLTNQRHIFNNALNSLIVRGQASSTTVKSGKVKLHLAMKQDLEFTAKGFFTLNYGLINSMLGAITTYLVVLMQLDKQIGE